jgi:anthranilate phosphoribosyltransferase
VSPEDVGIETQSWDDLRIENSQESLALVMAALTGSHRTASDFVCLNAGAAIYVSGASENLAEGVAQAKQSIASGAAKAKFDQLISLTQQLTADMP